MVDSSVCVGALIGDLRLPVGELIAPAFMDSEVLATIRRLEWAGLASSEDSDEALERMLVVDIVRVPSRDISRDALVVARELGWARTYDAEYVALARQRDATLVSADAKLRRGAARLVRTAAPSEV